jgi:hypothetical protein
VPTPDHGFAVAAAFNDMALHAFRPEACAACCASLGSL